MRTSVSGRRLVAALVSAFALHAAAQAAEPPVAAAFANPALSQTATPATPSTSEKASVPPLVKRDPAVATSATSVSAPFVAKTKYDTPNRFNAGAKFSAAEFDAWMQSRGIRVAKGKPAAATATATATVAAPGAVADPGAGNAPSDGVAKPNPCAAGAAVSAC